MRNTSALLLAVALFAAPPSFAAISPQPIQAAPAAPDVEKDGAVQAVAIFAKCIQFNGDVAAIRKWAAESNMTEAPPDQAKPFLLGRDGKAYGGDTPSGHLILTSTDEGLCSVFAGHADGTLVIQGFETWLGQNGFKFSPPHPAHHTGKRGLSAVSRNYLIRGGEGKPWHAVVTVTTGGKPQFEAILTAYRNKH